MWKNYGRMMDRVILGLLILGVATLLAERIWSTFILPEAPPEAIPVDSEPEPSAQNLLERAREMREANRPDLALEVLTQAHTIEPDSTGVLFELGQNHDRLGAYPQARENYGLIRSIDPGNPQGYGPVGSTYLAEGQLDQALLWMQQAQAIHPENLETAAWILVLNDSLDNFLAADHWSDWLQERITNQPQPIAMKARHHYLTGNFESAIQYANLALKLDFPNHLGSAAIFMRIKRDEALATGDPDSGIEIFDTQYPGLLSTPVQLTAETVQQAIDFAQLLKLGGRPGDSNRLLNAVIEYLDEPLSTSGSERVWLVPARAEALALLGDADGALAELSRITGAGWRFNWRWETELNYNFAAIRDTPGFRQIMLELNTYTETQRQRREAGEAPAPAVQ